MAYAKPHTGVSPLHRARPSTFLVELLAAVGAWRQRRATRRAVARLTTEQLHDIGYPEPPRPVLQVDPVLLARLQAMK